MKTASSQRHSGRLRRHRRVRKKITGTTDRPRLAVFRSNKHISIQVIDDLFNIPFVASRDGHWLVEAGKKLRVWRLPPPPQHEQLPWALFAATAPWMLLLIRRQDNPPPDERPV